jgi:sphingomyelin phosphodiesterase D
LPILSIKMRILFLFHAICVLVAVAARESTTQTTAQRPIYAIAHRVLNTEGVTAALAHGANAIEMDLTAWHYQWLADHDGIPFSAGSTAREIFEFTAQQRRSGKNIQFVWLDIKNPDSCEGTRGCSMAALRDLVRETLEPAGVRALYGFFQTENSRGYREIRNTLNANEAIVLSAEAGKVLRLYNSGPAIAPQRRIMDYGWTELGRGFGDCQEEEEEEEEGDKTCAELRMGAELRDQGELGKIMGWTSAEGDGELVERLLGQAGVDGIIYGFSNAEYKDDVRAKAAFEDIAGFIASSPNTTRLATIDDIPW